MSRQDRLKQTCDSSLIIYDYCPTPSLKSVIVASCMEKNWWFYCFSVVEIVEIQPIEAFPVALIRNVGLDDAKIAYATELVTKDFLAQMENLTANVEHLRT